MNILSEEIFEKAIVQSLVEHGGYIQGDAHDYDRSTGFFNKEVIEFLKTSQPKKWQKLEAVHGKEVEKRILQRIDKEMELQDTNPNEAIALWNTNTSRFFGMWLETNCSFITMIFTN
jgi:hypothetical protein